MSRPDDIFLLHQAVLGAAERWPQATAFRCRERAIGYAELATRVAALAAALRDAGVRRGDRVGIYTFKSIESAVGVFGIMAAGAAYVPMDPTLPAPRLRRIIEDCGIEVIVSHDEKARDLGRLLEEPGGLRAIFGPSMEAPAPVEVVAWSEISAAPGDDALRWPVTEQDLAYVMYTSGSTGTPKGLMHTHRSGLTYARLAARTYGLERTDRLGNHSPLHFDMSTLDYFAAPLVGAETVIIPEDVARLPASLAELIEAQRLTIWYSVPFALVQLLLRGSLDKRDCTSLRWVLFGGEPMPPKHLAGLMRLLPDARFSNVYGPAEVNQCTYYHVPRDRPLGDEPVPIGRVWHNAEGLVVDAHDRPVADGEPGELLVRTATMMQGYWNRPQLNERAFFRRAAPGGREDVFYRTGDLVRGDAEGNLIFLGRKDRQIKIRGYRVELEEIESVLGRHADVEEAAAYTVSGADGGNELYAAIVTHGQREVDRRALQAHLNEHLPRYALPKEIAVLASLPRTGSDKIDRRALAERAAAKPSS